MPHDLIRAHNHNRSRSLGHLVNAWIEHFVVHGPGDVQGEPIQHGDEYYGFVVDCYALGDTASNTHRIYDAAFFSRPKGCDKSGLGARFALAEALGPCRWTGLYAKGGEVYTDPWGLGFEYVYEPGEPMGRPVHVPYIRIMATEEGQTGAVYDSIHFNLTDPDALLSQIPGVDSGLTRTLLPGGGEITPSTASASAKDGGKETYVVFDETHLYNTPELRRMYATVTRNLRKRKRGAGTWYLETTTMFARGEDSVAEETYKLAVLLREAAAAGRTPRHRLLFDHRYGECPDVNATDNLKAAILEAFGEAIEWNDVESIVDEFHNQLALLSDTRRYFLNSAVDTADAWIASRQLAAIARPGTVIYLRDVIALGFDGSRGRKRGVTDATALVGFRLKDRHVFQIGIWEQPADFVGDVWTPPIHEILALVDETFRDYTVVAFYADPAKWEETVGVWEVKYGRRLKAKVTHEHPIVFDMTGGTAKKIVEALGEFLNGVIDETITYCGSSQLMRHLLNAVRRKSKAGMQIAKEHPDSAKKIDGAIAATLAVKAGMDALANGVKVDPPRKAAVILPRRVR